MDQLEFFDLPSPCIGVCQADDKGFCKGCYRSREERLYWHKIDNDTKRKIVIACGRRKKRALRANVPVLESPDTPEQGSLF
ncbi:DUF1289 domain-containing protein [Aestuariibacter salexigens]|uniref:DUF1289 domain-containing protein n=1 Tax=Aestuariibacter salexigens TaxID=226010 RepID=UPI0003FF2F51|nr:DUF1289 domain-containing protein [Aestuariibacter salexigens]